MWMFFLSSFINFFLASNLLDHFWGFFSVFLAFWPFPWQQQPFWKNQHFKAQLHMAYDISTRFHKIWSRHLREMCRTNFWRKKERRKNNNNKIWYDLKDHNMAPNSKNDDGYQFARTKSTWKPNVAQIWGYFYFDGHFGFKMVAIWCSMSYSL